MMIVLCEDCGKRVTSWFSVTAFGNGEEITEARWICSCGSHGTRTIITIEVTQPFL